MKCLGSLCLSRMRANDGNWMRWVVVMFAQGLTMKAEFLHHDGRSNDSRSYRAASRRFVSMFNDVYTKTSPYWNRLDNCWWTFSISIEIPVENANFSFSIGAWLRMLVPEGKTLLISIRATICVGWNVERAREWSDKHRWVVCTKLIPRINFGSPFLSRTAFSRLHRRPCNNRAVTFPLRSWGKFA